MVYKQSLEFILWRGISASSTNADSRRTRRIIPQFRPFEHSWRFANWWVGTFSSCFFSSESYTILILCSSCTNPSFYGCERTGSVSLILNPVRSARVRTIDSFAFKYGKVEISAKLPAGDWLSSLITFVPKDNVYGAWPQSGEIKVVQSKGNREMIQNGVNIGSEQVQSMLHFGPYAALDGWQSAQFSRNSKAGNGFNNDFHRYQMEWTPGKLWFSK